MSWPKGSYLVPRISKIPLGGSIDLKMSLMMSDAVVAAEMQQLFDRLLTAPGHSKLHCSLVKLRHMAIKPDGLLA